MCSTGELSVLAERTQSGTELEHHLLMTVSAVSLDKGRLETVVMLAINTLTILSMCMSILCLGCLMGRVSMLGLKDLTLLLPLQNPRDAKNSSEQKSCSEML